MPILFCFLFPQVKLLIHTLTFSAHNVGFKLFKDEIKETPLATHTAEQIRNIPLIMIPSMRITTRDTADKIFCLICIKVKVAVLYPMSLNIWPQSSSDMPVRS